jgi:hypothetical protein
MNVSHNVFAPAANAKLNDGFAGEPASTIRTSGADPLLICEFKRDVTFKNLQPTCVATESHVLMRQKSCKSGISDVTWEIRTDRACTV